MVNPITTGLDFSKTFSWILSCDFLAEGPNLRSDSANRHPMIYGRLNLLTFSVTPLCQKMKKLVLMLLTLNMSEINPLI